MPAVRMSDQCQVLEVGVRLRLFQLLNDKEDVGFAFFIDLAPADIGQPDLRY